MAQSRQRLAPVLVGCAGWSIPKAHADRFAAEGSHLERYASRLPAVEINSSFYRSHQAKTYARWAADTPDEFRFAVKAPRTITHHKRLSDAEEPLSQFLDEIAHLGEKLGPILVQLPPTLRFHEEKAAAFFEQLRSRFAGLVACEPRHRTWFTPEAEALLAAQRIARVAADPPQADGDGVPAGHRELAYVRLHGAPQVYYSNYSDEELAAWAERIDLWRAAAKSVWWIFDNTAEGHATANALQMAQRFGNSS